MVVHINFKMPAQMQACHIILNILCNAIAIGGVNIYASEENKRYYSRF